VKLAGFHLEPTNRCTLKCSACERTVFQERFGTQHWHNADLDLEAFWKFVDIDVSGMIWELCGNTGDPVYHPALHELVQEIKQRNGSIIMTTAATRHKREWWDRLLGLMDQRDQILFSVDGLPDTSAQYRVNADWPAMQMAMQMTAASEVDAVWKMIPFDFNQHEVEQVTNMAHGMGMKFQLDPSVRWEDHSELKPNIVHLYRERGTGEMNPACSVGHRHYISATGFYSPCCWAADHRFYYKSQFHSQRDNYDISKTTLSQLLQRIHNYDEQMRLDPAPVCSYTCRQI
jgi:molybdenum cofactor biosynthesis enzyme MoaA